MNKHITFYDWCVINNRYIYLENWDYDLNIGSPNDYSYSSAKKVYFKCPCGKHNSTIKPLNNITNPKRNNKENYCHECNSFGQWCLDNNKEELLKLWDYGKNDKSPFEIGYNSNKSYYFKCHRNLHESHKHTIYSIKNSNNKVACPKCNSIAQWGIDNLGDDFIDKYWSNKNITSPYDIKFGTAKKIWMICQTCGEDYLIKPTHFTSGVRHHGCSLLSGKSKLQRKVEQYIHNKYSNYSLLHENNCTIIPISPITNHQLYFDNEIKELKLLIEVMGLQHYETCSWDKKIAKSRNCTQEEVFKKRQFYDEYKKSFALENGYHYLEIPYWTEDDESYKCLINNKIKSLIKEV